MRSPKRQQHQRSRKLESKLLTLLLKKDAGKRTPKKTRIPSPKKKKRQQDGTGGINNIYSVIDFFNSHYDDENLNRKEELLHTTLELYEEFFNAFKNVPSFTLPEMKVTTFDSYKSTFNHINRNLWPDIEKQMMTTYTCQVDIKKRIHIHITIGDEDNENTVKMYLKLIIFWLHVVSQYATDTTCTTDLNIFLLLSDLKKVLPSGECTENTCLVKNTSVNTGYSLKCRNIVIYRKEEWLKVFIHETIHNYGLDFSFVDQKEERNVANLFGIKKPIIIRLYEAYTESWARMLHSMLIAYDIEKDDLDKFIKLADKNIRLERMNAYFQTSKIIKYMGLDKYMNETMDNLETYEEDTSNLSYYFIVCILYSDYQSYIQWCRNNNRPNILQFDNDKEDQQQRFVTFISQKKSLEEEFKQKIKYYSKTFFKTVTDGYLYRYMRKSLLEKKSLKG